MKISIAMCTYNGEQYLREQLDSIAKQTRLPDELVVSDDGSIDKTLKLIEEFASSSPFPVRISVNDKNLGTTRNFEKAIWSCEGEVIALCDQDDIWHVKKLELVEALLASAASVGLVISDAELVDAASKRRGRSLWQGVGFDSRKRKRVTEGKALEVFVTHHVVTGATMAFRSTFRDLISPIPPEGALAHDGWIALMIAAVADVGFIEEPLIKYREHPAQQMGARRRSTAESVIRAKKTDRNNYLLQASQFQQAYERLPVRNGNSSGQRVRSIVREKIVHLHARAMMPSQRLSRVPLVLRETLNLHYHRYSRGLFSAAKDLLV
jgi:glycosyltransferase involved in cell wall biosynthesis